MEAKRKRREHPTEHPEHPTEVDQKVGLSRNSIDRSTDKRRSPISIDDH
jgi:hypothetical protein